MGDTSEDVLMGVLKMYFFRQGNIHHMTKIEREQVIVAQLRRQSNMKRILVSDAIESLLDYVQKNEGDDLLLQGAIVKNKKEKNFENNPFRMRPSKNNCSIS